MRNWFIITESVAALSLVWCAFMLMRNNKVYKYRTLMGDVVSTAAHKDIEAGKDFMWRYRAMQAVDYQYMYWRFWRRVDSFYPDKSFLDAGKDGMQS